MPGDGAAGDMNAAAANIATGRPNRRTLLCDVGGLPSGINLKLGLEHRLA
jgi:hypothetical protein